MRKILAGGALIALGACSPEIPDSAGGVGFDNANLRPVPRAPQTQTSVLPPAQSVSDESAPQPARNRAGTALTDDDGNIQASPDNPAPEVVNNPGISDENDFGAVGERRSIEEDAERLARISDSYEPVAPTAVPERSETGPNIVAYALSTSHPVGTQVYRRFGFAAQARFERNCAKYLSPDHAQIDFMAKGGPKRDRMGLDPDGDGYACDWDPAPYRQVSE